MGEPTISGDVSNPLVVKQSNSVTGSEFVFST